MCDLKISLFLVLNLNEEYEKSVALQLEKLVAGELDPAHVQEMRTVPKRPLRSIEMRHAQVDKVRM